MKWQVRKRNIISKKLNNNGEIKIEKEKVADEQKPTLERGKK